MKINAPNWYPAYVNPDFSEICELAKSGWDTCRILTNDDNEDIVIASGFGNTHDSVQSRYYTYLGATEIERNGRRRWRLNGAQLPQNTPYILYYESGIALMNCEDISGHQRERYDSFSQYFNEKQCEILTDLINESGLAK